jgi:hypothetical protein
VVARAGSKERARTPHLLALQRSAGNRATTMFVQRWTVPGSLACDEVVPHMDANSPYAPEWAETRSTHSFSGNVRVQHVDQSDGTVTSTASGHPGVRVRVSSPVDRPEWNPTARPNRAAEVAAWRSMRASLDAHEREHQRIGQTNNAELTRRYQAVHLTATGPDRQSNTADLTTQLQAEQQGWVDWAQAQQDAIDPFRGANLACPAAAEDTDS